MPCQLHRKMNSGADLCTCESRCRAERNNEPPKSQMQSEPITPFGSGYLLVSYAHRPARPHIAPSERSVHSLTRSLEVFFRCFQALEKNTGCFPGLGNGRYSRTSPTAQSAHSWSTLLTLPPIYATNLPTRMQTLERWLSGRKRAIGVRVGVMNVSGVRIPPSPP